MPEHLHGAMGEILDHLENCPIALIAIISAEVQKRGMNKATVPLGMFRGQCPEKTHAPLCWIVTVEVDMRSASFDIEAHDPDLNQAVAKAVRATRRQLTDTRKAIA